MKYSLRTHLLASDKLLNKAYKMNDHNKIEITEIGKISAFLIKHCQPEKVISNRRRNFNFWIEKIDFLKDYCEPIYLNLAEGVCPIGFPVLIRKRDEVRKKLYKKQIPVRTYWDVLPQAINGQKYSESIYLRDHIMVLPVHQSLEITHLKIVWGELLEILNY